MEKYIVIMAGGVGSRFWPRSRKEKPKQLLNIFGENSMIQGTVERLEGFVEKDKIFVVTNKIQKALIEEQLPEIPAENIIAEPVGKNTAPCVGLAAALIARKNSEAVIVTLPADHLIKDHKKFQKILQLACEFAYESKGLLTFGINPTRPDTGYGYINFEKEEIKKDIYKVKRFVEKPDLKKAEEYLKSGDYLWNSGMFIWRADVILEEIKKYLPNLNEGLAELDECIGKNNFYEKLGIVYPALESISVDYGIMEKSDKVFLIKGDFDWSDVGSWEAVYELSEKDSEGNSSVGDVLTKYSKNSYIFSPEKFTAVIGLKDVVVIDTKDALLVCHRDNVQDVRDAVEHLKKNKRDELI
jgi:mannose-1-phosphate guanylyltransferase